MNKLIHIPVLLNESINFLNIKKDGIYIDATYGRGGHSNAILANITTGKLFVLDCDIMAINHAKQQFANDNRVIICHNRFSELKQIATKYEILNRINGILVDLGPSSPQLDNAIRGFSFQHDSPLDMRLDQRDNLTAAEIINKYNYQDLADILYYYGEEFHARKISKMIIATRQKQQIKTTKELVNIIIKALPYKYLIACRKKKKSHVATKTFQALRIYINRELNELQTILKHATSILAPDGKLAIISFHSLEDRLIKRFIQENILLQNNQYVKSSYQEISMNTRSRSATLRMATKIL